MDHDTLNRLEQQAFATVNIMPQVKGKNTYQYCNKDGQSAGIIISPGQLLDLVSAARKVNDIEALLGAFEDGSEMSFKIHPDDATKTWHVDYAGKSFYSARWWAAIHFALNDHQPEL